MLASLPPTEWSLDHAAHLLRRAGFGGTPGEVRAFHALGLDRAVDSLLHPPGDKDSRPDWTTRGDPGVDQMLLAGAKPGTADGFDERRRMLVNERRKEDRQQLLELRAWWLARMRDGRRPLLEKMTLFWHGHFATSIVKVKDPRAMWRQNETLRRHALGDFGELVRAMARDPAMIRWLDLGQSRRDAPNENFARELMELFTLGIGNYSEDDIKAAARAFTGWRIDPATGEATFNPRQHDADFKRFLGHGGRYDGDDIVTVILTQPACARFVGRRVWEFFAYENPEPDVLESFAQAFRDGKYQVAPMLRTIFRSRAFYSAKAARTHIKSPVEWLVQLCISLECEIPAMPATDRILEQLGQSLFAPPNVRGWEGGRAWISSSTLMLRCNVANAFLGGRPGAARERGGARVDSGKILPSGLPPDALEAELSLRFFGSGQPQAVVRKAVGEVPAAGLRRNRAVQRALLNRLLSAPEYQLA